MIRGLQNNTNMICYHFISPNQSFSPKKKLNNNMYMVYDFYILYYLSFDFEFYQQPKFSIDFKLSIISSEIDFTVTLFLLHPTIIVMNP